MGIRFVFGGSGYGKSSFVYQYLIDKSMEGCEEQGLSKEKLMIVVPDQFTMQTQKELVEKHPRKGIMNIDVLSFNRLCHRIMEEESGQSLPVLDDTGKSLVLKKVAENLKDELPTLGSRLKKQGYIHEVKSAISEFMQYGLSPKDVEELKNFSGQRSALKLKLTDLQKLYQGFLDYIRDHFITTEETLEASARLIKDTSFLKDSIVVFDGFTGFTPIQNRFILELNGFVKEIILTMTCGKNCNPYKDEKEQNLFYLTQKAVKALLGETSMEERKNLDIWIDLDEKKCHRFSHSPALLSLEQNLFRSQIVKYEKEQNQVHIFAAEDPKEEVSKVGARIAELVRSKGLQYRDVGVIVSDMESYGPFVENIFAQMDIPCFLDRNRSIELNPCVEYIKSALNILIHNFSLETVMHYLRSGLSGFETAQIDRFENYLIATGIRGSAKWNKPFEKKTRYLSKGMSEEAAEEQYIEINAMREKILDHLQDLQEDSRAAVEVHVKHLYDYLKRAEVEEKLEQMSRDFEEKGDLLRSREYKQVYGKIMELLEQLHDLLSGEVISREEFYEILEAGIQEIEIGLIPQNVDRVLVGDMERTRMSPVKVLFCLGVNEGYIPKGTTKGGIISDMDREFLKTANIELSPSPKQQMFIQRLYLYMNLTKPSEELFISYTYTSNDGKQLRPSYLIKTIKRILPNLKEENYGEQSIENQIVTKADGLDVMAKELREYAEGVEKGEEFYSLYESYRASEFQNLLQKLTDAAFFSYKSETLERKIASLVYGWQIEASISKMEKYAACAYSYFLQYGLSLKEREELSFAVTDMGNVFHDVLNGFAQELRKSDYTWFDFPKDWEEETLDILMEKAVERNGNGVLNDNSRLHYQIGRMKRIIKRTVEVLHHQVKKGSFTPVEHESKFQVIHDLKDLNMGLTEKEKIFLEGRIDRVDLFEDDRKVYVKIIDYKSGNKHFDLAALYYGLQLQLVTYLDVAVQKQKKLHREKEVVPAAMLYYHIDDPMVEDAKTEEEIQDKILKELRMRGLVNEDRDIIQKLDGSFDSKSDVIPVEFKKDGTFAKAAKVMSGDDLKILSDYAMGRMKQFCGEILTGRIDKNPFEKKEEHACQYCSYKDVCGFDTTLPGYEKRKLKELETEEIMENIRKETENWALNTQRTNSES